MHKIRWTYFLLAGAVVITVFLGCLLEIWPDDNQKISQGKRPVEILVIKDWYKHSLLAERYAEGYKVPVVARMYAYLGIAAYETAAYKTQRAQSFNGLTAEWTKPPLPDSIALDVALNSCYHRMLEHFHMHAPHLVQQDRLAVYQRWNNRFEETYSPYLIEQSAKWGKDVADALYAWSATDSLGHMAHLHNYDRNYMIPHEPGKWQPSPEDAMPPLLPYWGGVRTFTVSSDEQPVLPPVSYSEQRGSVYYNQLYELYALSSPLSNENKWIAEFWSDDLHGLTFSPAGRWMSITAQVIDLANPSVSLTLETYLKTGIALSDATVLCWYGKYKYGTERPATYIRKFIDPAWKPLHGAPPFPGYPSGHSAMGAAVCQVLTDLYGKDFKMTDRSHEGRNEFKGDPRFFKSFDEMARENAFSRLVLGVHVRADCEEGLRLGALIGKKVAEIPINDPLVIN